MLATPVTHVDISRRITCELLGILKAFHDRGSTGQFRCLRIQGESLHLVGGGDQQLPFVVKEHAPGILHRNPTRDAFGADVDEQQFMVVRNANDHPAVPCRDGVTGMATVPS